jgi:hypothetical protein
MATVTTTGPGNLTTAAEPVTFNGDEELEETVDRHLDRWDQQRTRQHDTGRHYWVVCTPDGQHSVWTDRPNMSTLIHWVTNGQTCGAPWAVTATQHTDGDDLTATLHVTITSVTGPVTVLVYGISDGPRNRLLRQLADDWFTTTPLELSTWICTAPADNIHTFTQLYGEQRESNLDLAALAATVDALHQHHSSTTPCH